MRILHMGPNEFPQLSVQHPTKLIWKELSNGIEQYHVLGRSQTNQRFHDVEDNIHLHLMRKNKSSKSFFFTSLYAFTIVRKHKVDAIVSQCPILGGFTAIIIKKIYRVPVLIEIHGMEYFRYLNSKNLLHYPIKFIIKFVFKNATKVRSLSPKMTELLYKSKVKANIVEIPNRVNLSIFNSPKTDFALKNPIKIVSVGRFVWEKGYEFAIDAIKIISQSYPVELHLIGGGILKQKYIDLIGECNFIHLYDRIPQHEFMRFINDADIYIQTSVSEGMPRTLLEAMALRLPIITTDVGAISGIMFNQINCLLIESGNVDSIVQAVVRLVNDAELRVSLANRAYYEATNIYEWNKVFTKYQNEIITMVNKI